MPEDKGPKPIDPSSTREFKPSSKPIEINKDIKPVKPEELKPGPINTDQVKKMNEKEVDALQTTLTHDRPPAIASLTAHVTIMEAHCLNPTEPVTEKKLEAIERIQTRIEPMQEYVLDPQNTPPPQPMTAAEVQQMKDDLNTVST